MAIRAVIRPHSKLLLGTAFPYPTPERTGGMYGSFTRALREMFPAAIVSARPANPQDTQENIA